MERKGNKLVELRNNIFIAQPGSILQESKEFIL